MKVKLKLNVKPKDAKIVFSSETQFNQVSDSEIEIESGSKVSYAISSEGYTSIEKSLIVSKDMELKISLKALHNLTIEVNPTQSTLNIIKDGIDYFNSPIGNKIVFPFEYGSKIKITLSKATYQTASKEFTMNGDKNLTFNLVHNLSQEDAEKLTNQLSDIKLIDREEYLQLPKLTQDEYTLYSTSLLSSIGVEGINAINNCIAVINQLGPIIEKISPLTNGSLTLPSPLPIQGIMEQIQPIMDVAKTVGDMIKSITKPLSMVGLSALENILTMAFKLIGALAGIVYALFYNPYNLIKAYYEAFEDIDFDHIKEILNSEVSPNIDYLTSKIDTIEIPDDVIRNQIKGTMKTIKSYKDGYVQVCESAEEIKMALEMAKMAEEGYETTLSTMATMGLNWAVGSVEQAIKAMKVDYENVKMQLDLNNEFKNTANNFKDKANSMINGIPTKYIKKTDLELLNQVNNEIQNSSTKEWDNGYTNGQKLGKKGANINEYEAEVNKKTEESKETQIDVSVYLSGFKEGYDDGLKKFEAEQMDLETEKAEANYDEGYSDGYACVKDSKIKAIKQLEEELKREPSESEIKLRRIRIIDEQFKQDIEKHQDKNYENGWKAGRQKREAFDNQLQGYQNDTVEGKIVGEADGSISISAARNKVSNYLSIGKSDYFVQGYKGGYNTYQSKYNRGYADGWLYQTMYDPEYTWQEVASMKGYNVGTVEYTGFSIGWSDSKSGSERHYRETF